jgi:2-phosphosulfolactate phosphatase
MNKVTVCISPALYSFYAQKEAIVIIVDIFRATTSMCAAFNNGARSIRTVATVEEAIHYKEKGYLVAAERNVKKCNFADFGNSPFDFSHEKVADKEIIFTTTNGTQAVQMALDADEILIGAFSNITTLTNHCNSKKKNVLILCSGWNNRFCLEDTLFAGALTEKLIKTGKFCSDSDATLAALELWKIAQPDLLNYICSTEHYERLKSNGLENSVEYCLTEDTTPVLPVYNKISNTFIFKNNN